MLESFIGPWKWRSLIEVECRYSQSPVGEQETNHEQPLSADWPHLEANQHLYVSPVADLDATVIFFGGRRFLVNVPEGTVNQLSKYEPPYRRKLHQSTSI